MLWLLNKVFIVVLVFISKIITVSQIGNEVTVSFISGSYRSCRNITDLVYSCKVTEGTFLKWVVNKSQVAKFDNSSEIVQHYPDGINHDHNNMRATAFMREMIGGKITALLVVTLLVDREFDNLEVVCESDGQNKVQTDNIKLSNNTCYNETSNIKVQLLDTKNNFPSQNEYILFCSVNGNYMEWKFKDPDKNYISFNNGQQVGKKFVSGDLMFLKRGTVITEISDKTIESILYISSVFNNDIITCSMLLAMEQAPVSLPNETSTCLREGKQINVRWFLACGLFIIFITTTVG